MGKTVAITVNYNNYYDTIEAVESLLNETYPYHKILIVDNSSPNQSIPVLSAAFSSEEQVILLVTPKNGGYAYGVNFGIKYALNNFDFDHFMIVNNDAVSDKNLNKAFIAYFEGNPDPKLGLLTGKIFYYNDANRIWSAGGHFQPKKCKGSHYGGGRVDDGHYDKTREVTFATGCLWFFRKDLIDEVGLLPEEYFMYYEDLDFCLKIHQKGFKIVYLPTAKLFHKIGGSISNESPLPKTIIGEAPRFNKEKIIIARKYLDSSGKLIFFVWLLNRNIRHFFEIFFKEFRVVNTFQGTFEGLKMRIYV